MKKLILFACVATTLFTSCKKDKTEMLQPQSPTLTYDQQAADLIKQADKNLYDRVYNQDANQRQINFGIRFIPGTFVILQGDVASGTCFPTNSVCMVIVSASITNTSGTSILNTNAVLTFPQYQPAQLILNTTFPVVRNITRLATTSGSSGNVNISYTE